jgi:hypothetical protein
LKNKIQNNNTIPHNDLFKLLVGARYSPHINFILPLKNLKREENMRCGVCGS